MPDPEKRRIILKDEIRLILDDGNAGVDARNSILGT